MSTVAERVQKGIDLLDAHGPENWRERIMLHEFNIKSACNCVLGFVYADATMDEGSLYCSTNDMGYYKGKELLNIYESGQSADYGFDAHTFGYSGDFDSRLRQDYEALQSEWLRRLMNVDNSRAS